MAAAQLVRAADLHPREFAGHSLRSGYATQAARDGHRPTEIAATTATKTNASSLITSAPAAAAATSDTSSELISGRLRAARQYHVTRDARDALFG